MLAPETIISLPDIRPILPKEDNCKTIETTPVLKRGRGRPRKYPVQIGKGPVVSLKKKKKGNL